MKRNLYTLAFATAISVALISCGSSDTKTEDADKTDKTEITEDTEQVEEATPSVYTINSDNIIIYTGPGEDFGGLVDERASEITGQETYSAVWSNNKVIVLSTDGDWSEIEIVEGPQKHKGWILTECIDM